MSVPTTSNAVTTSTSRFAIETYYDILNYVDCKHELARLARTAPVLQRPAESRLYRTIALHGERDLNVFRTLLLNTNASRIGGFVKEFTYDEMDQTGRTLESEGNDLELSFISDVLGRLKALNKLCIHMEDAARWRTSRILNSLESGTLTVLRCSVDFDAPFVAFLRRQTHMQELHVECLSPEYTTHYLICNQRRFLPNLHALRTNSHNLALALLPGRPISHIWITEVKSFSSNATHCPLYSTAALRPIIGRPREAQDPQQSVISPESDTTTRETYWSDVFHEYATVLLPFHTSFEARTRSVRLEFEEISQANMAEVLKNFAKYLGTTIRTLGFLNSAAVEELTNWSDKDNVEMFNLLHTVVLAFTPSLAEVERLAKSPALPALRNVACYGFSRTFEYLCIPVNDAGQALALTSLKPEIVGSSPKRDASGWTHRTGDVEWATNLTGRMRATPVHDPDYRLWLDA
ncbi:hypothetical protein SCHPADRAFT_996700 [Schizopora paradoxa]|uniref:F-box domain-containing protein n=1 Tax=Schizopora paradoxa TaxID=27342 RepID=A0A0H2RQI7_9AGAM|nr:hypothetical protein SCHPADRAFT_996700 [Schizopora paradoxa]